MKQPHITVGIMFEPKIEFVFNNEFRCMQTQEIFKGQYVAEVSDGKVMFGGECYNELAFIPVTPESSSFDLIDVTIGINFHWERKENQRFLGGLKLIVEDNKLTAINELLVEDYLVSVISSEMSATSSLELLKAHAVISRSWLLAPIFNGQPQNTEAVKLGEVNDDTFIKWYERDAHANFNVCADDHCQRYQGITRAGTELVKQAIAATYGEVLQYDNLICDARYSKSCGGVAELFENCWDNVHHDYLTNIIDNPEAPTGYSLDLRIEEHADRWIRTAPDAFCNTHDKEILSQVLNHYDQETTDFYRWRVNYTQVQLSELIRRRSGIDFGDIIDLIPVERGTSGRLVKLKIVGSKRTLTVGKELEIRKWLSESHLYSSAFVVDKSAEGDFTLIGAGWGHGVGLCQIGAAVMGAKGYNYNQILVHYFPGAAVNRVYQSNL